MRIESVKANAFGPMTDAELELAPGLTVIVGANESAKSSWHAAIYAGLCGRRRGRGAVTKAEKAFSDLHRPWDGGDWRASVVIRLDDGQRVEITQDLAGKVDSRAVDADLGRDVSGEIMHEGAPDGSRWLGLDRDSFLATACMNQAGLLRVLDEADGLQDHIARAAATAGTDANSATALAAIANFHREQVGVDKQGAKKRLRKGKEAVAAATAALTDARVEHERYVTVVTEAQTLRDAAGEATTEVVTARGRAEDLERLLAATRAATEVESDDDRARERAGSAFVELDVARRRFERAAELDASLGSRAPTGLAEFEEVSRAVAAALAGWRASAQPEPLAGESAAALREQLEQLPNVPEGDQGVDPSVRQAVATLAQRQAVLTAHADLRPVDPGADDDPELAAAIEATAAVVRDLAAELAAARAVDTPDAQALVALDEAAAAARMQADELRAMSDAAAARPREATPRLRAATGSRRRTLLLAGAGVVLAAGVVLLALGLPIPGVVAVAVAVALGAGSLSGSVEPSTETSGAGPARPQGTHAPAWAEVSDAERTALAAQEQLRAARTATSAAAAARSDVQARCEARGLPADVERLQALAAAVELARGRRTAFAQWSGDEVEYALAVASAQERLREALAGRGIVTANEPAVDARELADEYERACAVRASAAAATARRPDLQQRHAEREKAEQSLLAAAARHQQAAAAILKAASLAGLVGEAGVADADRYATDLEAWQGEHAQSVRQAEESQGAWAELVALLGGSTLEQLMQAVDDLGTRHAELVGLVETAEVRTAEAAGIRDVQAAAVGIDPVTVLDVGSVQGLVASALDRVEERRSEAGLAASAADRAGAVRRERAAGVVSVAAAEEALAVEQAKLERVNRLAATLDLTADFLRQAQARVHRDIAPVLVRTLEEWLPGVTGGRYVHARVDPASLVVQVRGPHQPWRQADRLSVGTAEQVYLLLRVALAEHLTTKGESCPLLLDDVTVQADPVRTEAILDLLLSLSQDRQIVLFAQEPMVAEWAARRLTGDQNSLIELEQVGSV